MRLSLWIVLGMLGCGDDHGAVLTVSAPDGSTATRIEIVLASADPGLISTIDNQRTNPAKLDEAAVVYYRQRALGGVVEVTGPIDGFRVRIEPDVATPDEFYIPFVLAYDRDNLIGIGSVEDEAGVPLPVKINDLATIKYTVAMEPVTAASPTAAIGRGEVMIVSCLDDAQAPWTSGLAWRSALGLQRRLLLPDRARDSTTTDATSREPDLDCDQHAAWSDDCDDLRNAFFVGQREMCDGVDRNCDGGRYQVVSCSAPNAVCDASRGVQLCDEQNLSVLTTCRPDPACTCAGATMGGCNRCVIDHAATGDPNKLSPCEPAVGRLSLSMCTDTEPCVVEVIEATGNWNATIAPTESGPFQSKVAGIHAAVALRVERAGLVSGNAGGSVGRVELAVTTGTSVQLFGIDLELGQSGAACRPLATGMGDLMMECSP